MRFEVEGLCLVLCLFVLCAASGYTPAQRGLSWLKLKRDYLEGLADSLDLVPIGAWYGQGRKVRSTASATIRPAQVEEMGIVIVVGWQMPSANGLQPILGWLHVQQGSALVLDNGVPC